jgi:hypothetical protein
LSEDPLSEELLEVCHEHGVGLEDVIGGLKEFLANPKQNSPQGDDTGQQNWYGMD